jgi:hypothetical protein
LEDGVAYAQDAKDQARASLKKDLSGTMCTDIDVLVYPRINHPSSEYWKADIEMLVQTEASGLWPGSEPDQPREPVPACNSTSAGLHASTNLLVAVYSTSSILW